MASIKDQPENRFDHVEQTQSSRRFKDEIDSDLNSSGSEEDDYVDIDDDTENIKIVSLFDDTEFADVSSMLAYVKSTYQFDLAAVQKQLGLDFLETIKLVNFIRQQVADGRSQDLQLQSKSVFEHDRYLQPVLDDDALLYNLEDIIDANINQAKTQISSMPVLSGVEEGSDAYLKVIELQQALVDSQTQVLATQQRLELAEKALSAARDVETDPPLLTSSKWQRSAGLPKYQGNYDGPELHRTMIADKARTEAYRDFILNNRHLFEGKTVLDVGCGTGILSLFCADAGAKTVYAIDQSEEIIKKAREIVFRNGKQDTVKLISGRIQEVDLPVPKVDIIVSEWMGYCLLFEAMFDSVIWARDRYLKPGGLMVPSLSALYVAPFCHPAHRSSRIDFWDNVYGYDMSCFKPDVLEMVEVDTSLESSHLAGEKQAFCSFDLSKATVDDLSFCNKSFSLILKNDISQQLDGFAIWFDVTFVAPDTAAPTGSSRVILSTGPDDVPTHWQQGLCLIDRNSNKGKLTLTGGSRINGDVSFQKEGEGKEGLDITIAWQSDAGEKGKQKWLLH